MSFQSRFDNTPVTPQKNKTSQLSPTAKRIRLFSPPPVNKTSSRSARDHKMASTAKYSSPVSDDCKNEVSRMAIFFDHYVIDNSSSDTIIEVKDFKKRSSRLNSNK